MKETGVEEIERAGQAPPLQQHNRAEKERVFPTQSVGTQKTRKTARYTESYRCLKRWAIFLPASSV